MKIGSFNPELLILDIMMPRLDGFEVCRRIRADETTKDMSILAITAYGHEEMEKIKKSGAQICLSKPLTMQKLLLSVRRLIG
jgi:CheY-like chemotaxis protein